MSDLTKERRRLTEAELARHLELLLNDVGVLQCNVTVTYDQATKTLTVVESITSSAGPDLFSALVTDT